MKHKNLIDYLGKFKNFPQGKKPVFIIAATVCVVGTAAYGHLTNGINFFDDEIKSETVEVLGVSSEPRELKLGATELNKTYVSPVFKSNFEFNAIAPHWQEVLEQEDERYIELRVSDDSNKWTSWMKMEVGGPVRNDDPLPDRAFPETPLFVKGKFFQYRMTLERTSLSEKSPRVKDLKMNYIDSRRSLSQQVVATIKNFFKQPVQASGHDLNVISREAWGSPDPYGDEFMGTNRFWYPTHRPVKQVFLHHTVHSNVQSDPAATVRAIWDFHANTRLWGDIGYNYILDHEGNVYEGRAHGDNVTGGHVRDYNMASMGVSIMGCFQNTSSVCNELNNGNTTAPTTASLDSLSTLLSWKMTGYGIDPLATRSFCDYKGENCLNISTIAAHRDASDTECNGQLFYDKLPDIRQAVADKNSNNYWAQSAKQQSYLLIDFNGQNSSEVTLSFKNTGTATWSNATNPLFLKTATPDGRLSIFEHPEWVNGTTLAKLTEESVAPGQTGTFVFKLNEPTDFNYSVYFESLQLAHQDGTEFKNTFVLPVKTLTYQSLAKPREMNLTADTQKSSLFTLQPTGGTLSAGQIAWFETKTKINGTWYLRTKYDSTNGYHRGIPLSRLEDLPNYSSLAKPREMRAVLDARKTDLLLSGETGSTVNEGEIVWYKTKTNIDGTWYLRSRYDTDKSYHRGIPLSSLQNLPAYKPLANPRNMKLVKDTRRTNLFTFEATGGTLSEGRIIYYDSKVYLKGKWYLRSSYDTDMNYHRGIPLSRLQNL